MTNKLPELDDCSDWSGKKVFVRGSLNVPVAADGSITNEYRLQKLLPTINHLRNQGGRTILAGHMSDTNQTLKPVADYLEKHFPLTFIRDYAAGAAREVTDEMEDRAVVLLENLRQYPGETANAEDFARMLADYADIYVNESFDAAHRAHASIVGVPALLPAYAGLRFSEEVETLAEVLNPEHPFTFILGGAKFSTKLPLVEKFAALADDVFVGGVLANAYLAAAGRPMGRSRLPEKSYDLSAGLASDALQLPSDVVCESATGEVATKSVSEVASTDTIVDLGPVSVARMTAAVKTSTLVVWNGPLGWYEKGFSDGTDRLAVALAEAKGKTILGGGDTAAVILDDMSPDDFSFVSTAGGAMITFLSDESLPGIEALIDQV
jgi:phosphoglycerate kinase